MISNSYINDYTKNIYKSIHPLGCGSLKTEIKVKRDCLVVKNFETNEAEIVSYFREIAPENLDERFEKSLKLGVVALKTLGTTEKIDYVEKQFYRLRQEFAEITDKTREDIETQIVEIFGEEGSFSATIDEHFGENGKLVKQIFDPTREGSPLCELRSLIMERLDGISKELGMKKGVEEVTEVTPQKGYKFEDECEELLSEIVKKHLGDELSRTTDEVGRISRSKKGDFVITIGERPDCKIVLETKDVKNMTLPQIHEMMKEAIENRDAKYGIFVTKWVESLPTSVGCFNEYQDNHLVCALASKKREGIINPEVLHIAVCWARIRSLIEKAEAEGINVSLIQAKLGEIGGKLNLFSKIKLECTNVEKAAKQIRSLSDDIRDGIDTELEEIRGEIVRVLGK